MNLSARPLPSGARTKPGELVIPRNASSPREVQSSLTEVFRRMWLTRRDYGSPRARNAGSVTGWSTSSSIVLQSCLISSHAGKLRGHRF